MDKETLLKNSDMIAEEVCKKLLNDAGGFAKVAEILRGLVILRDTPDDVRHAFFDILCNKVPEFFPESFYI